MARVEKRGLSQSLVDLLNEIASISDFRAPAKKQCSNLARRLKLLLPMFEEIRDGKDAISDEAVKAMGSLKEALVPAKELLMFGSEGSKIYLVLERDQTMGKFQEVTSRLEQALREIPFENLEISDEVKEQVELVLSQFKRAKGRVDAPDDELYGDLVSLYSNGSGNIADPDVLRRVAKKLELMTVTELTEESLALHEMVTSSGGDPGQSFEKMSMVLKRIKDFVQTENPNLEAPARQRRPPPSCRGPRLQEGDQKNPFIPEDFRCPISLELMKDPVIVSSGQTYERACIEKWLEEGHLTCPKTQQTLTSTAVTPNYVLRSLIAQWCEANGIEPPKRPSRSQPSKASSSASPADRNKIEEILHKLGSQNPEEQRSAAGEIRLLAKRSTDNRIAIAAAGAIPLLVKLLSTPDSRTQEHAVTALLNLSICEANKGRIVTSGAVPGIVQVLRRGSMEARENAAATLFSLSVMDENKVTIGSLGAIPPLVTLLSEGTQRGKKDAATALFNLCIFQGNKGKAVRAGLVPELMRLLTEPDGGMVDEALAILAILSSHPEGKVAIGSANAVPVLVEFIRNGLARNKENAAAVLVHLCSWDQSHLVEVQKLGIMGPLIEMAESSTDRGKRKAGQLLDRISRFNEQQKLSGPRPEHAETQPDSQNLGEG